MFSTASRRRTVLAACAAASVTLSALAALSVAALADDAPGARGKATDPTALPTTRLHNGWTITPVGTHHEVLGDMLLSAVLRPDGRFVAFVNGGGAAHNVHIADAATGKVAASLPVERAQTSGGVAWSPDGTRLYVSGGNAGRIYVFTVADSGALTARVPLTLANLKTTVPPPPADPARDAGRSPAKQDAPEEDAFLSGLTLSPDGKTLCVANLAGDSVYALDAETGATKAFRKLTAKDRPGALRFAPDGKTLYAALWGAAKVLALDPATLETRATLVTGRHPNDLLLTKDGSRLFVSCGNDDRVDVFQTATNSLQEKIALTITRKAPLGVTPSALALSPDGEYLFVACSDLNAVAMIEVERPGQSRVNGLIPTTHYPTTVAVSADSKRLFVGSGKGLGTGPNGTPPDGKIDPVAPKGYPYIGTLLKGVLSTVPVPDVKTLADYTKKVYANTPFKDALLETPAKAPKRGDSPVPSRVGDPSPIKHVLYIIKENRTYDQVFGDMTDKNGRRIGKGDPSLTLFGEEITPNHHALAREYVLLDNLYADGEVSVDGHHWSNGAFVPDAMQRLWQAQYGGKGAPPIRYGDFGDPLAETPAGARIWDRVAQTGKTFRTYYYHVDKNRSEEWAAARAARARDYQAADIFIKDLAGFEAKNEMPAFMVMALSEDHTSGTRPGSFTPQACVASNDLALGKIVEACSRSKFWKEMAVFVIEDDAQNGPDHVDAHRTVGLVISPYTRQAKVDSTFYSTCSLLRTMELILGAPPLSPFDAAATPMYASFTAKADAAPYRCRPAKIDLEAKNGQRAYGAGRSLAFDFSEPDLLTVADEDALNRILWHSVKGAQTPYPGITRRPLFDIHGRSVVAFEDDDEEEDKAQKSKDKRK